MVSLLVRYHVNYEGPQGTGDIPIQAESRGEVPILITDMLIYNIGSLSAITGIDNEKD